MSPYHKTLLKYVSDDRFAGVLDQPDAVGEVGMEAESAGRRLAVRFMLRIKDDFITDIRYQVYGCGFSMAACAAAAEFAQGKALAEVDQLDKTILDKRLGGVPEDRDYCLQIALEALRAAVKSARLSGKPFVQNLNIPAAEHGPRVDAEDPLYRRLIESPCPEEVCSDRHLFACLLAVAQQEPWPAHMALGIDKDDLTTFIQCYFPQACWFDRKNNFISDGSDDPLGINTEVRQFIRSYIPAGHGRREANWLADILAARSTLPGHLWVAMGLFSRAELSAAIRRHLPGLADANGQNMRWKKFFFKQVCESKGGVLCAAPNCGVCSDYRFCLVESEGVV